MEEKRHRSRTCPERCPNHEQLKIERMYKPYRSEAGLRWAPHRGQMIPESEWIEEEYMDWKAKIYLEAAEIVQEKRRGKK